MDGALADAAFRREVIGDGRGDLHEGHAVEPGADEGLQLRVVVDLGGGARAMGGAVRVDRPDRFGQGREPLLVEGVKGRFKGR